MPETVAGKAAESIHLGVWEPANAPSEGTLEITALVSGGTLVIRLLGRPEALPVGWGEAFSKSFSETLFALVEDGLSDGSNCRYVPADFPDSELTDEDMTQILEQLQVAI